MNFYQINELRIHFSLEAYYTYFALSVIYNEIVKGQGVCSKPYSLGGNGVDFRRMKKTVKYSGDMPRRMYSFFINYNDTGLPSFVKFARSIGATSEDIEKFRRRREFDRAYKECSEIRRDYLIDNALAKRYDASVTKFLLSCEFKMDREIEDDEKNRLDVTVEVLE